MSGPRAMDELLDAWRQRLTHNENESLSALSDAVAQAIRRAQKLPPSIDRRCAALIVTRLEEAEHWAFQAWRLAVDLPPPDGQSER